MSSERVYGQLLAIRSVLDNLIGEMEDAQREAKGPECSHPEEKRKYEGTMGNVTGFTCGQCNVSVPVVKDVAAMATGRL